MNRRQKLKEGFESTIKDPLTIILFVVCWLALESPAIVGEILYIITRSTKWLAIAGGWVALTAPPLPIPVVPICLAFAFGGRKVIRLIQDKISNKRR